MQSDDKYIIAKTKVSGEVEDDEEIGELVPPNVTNKQVLSAADTLKRCASAKYVRGHN